MTAVSSRRRSLIVPREHGAWGILLVPLFTGAAVGLLDRGRTAPLLPLTIAALALFWLRTPVESWTGAAAVRARSGTEFQLVRRWVFGLSAASAAALAWLFSEAGAAGLLAIGSAAAIAFLLQAIVKRSWKGARAAAQIVGAAGLTSTAPAAYYAATGRLDATAWALWAANLLFAANQIHFVQTRIHSLHASTPAEKLVAGRGFLAGQIALIAILAAVCTGGLLRWSAAIGFVPILARGFVWFAGISGTLTIHTLGKRELIHAVFFGILLVAGFQFPH